MNEPILFAVDDHVATLTLNNPAALNPISEGPMVEALVAACARVNADTSIRAVILTGAGKGFSSGGNVQHMKNREDIFAGGPSQVRDSYRRGIQRVPPAVFHLEVPTIAAVNGPAVGAGCDLAMMCDVRIASERAVFAESFVKLGIIPGDGGAWFLPRAIGWARAAEMLFTGDTIDAQTALAWGLVSKVVAPEHLLGEAHALAARIAKNPPQAVRMSKKLLREAQHATLSTVLEMSAAMQAIAHHTADHAEAMAAFFDKRPGVYTGA